MLRPNAVVRVSAPGAHFSSPLKYPVFCKGWGRAGMLGLHWGLRRVRFGLEPKLRFCWVGLGLKPKLRFGVWLANDNGWSRCRSLGFSPSTNFSSPLKSQVFFEGCGRAVMLGLPFVLGVRNAWATGVGEPLCFEMQCAKPEGVWAGRFPSGTRRDFGECAHGATRGPRCGRCQVQAV